MSDEPQLLTDEELEKCRRLEAAFEYYVERGKARLEMIELLRGRFNIPPTINLKDEQIFIKQLRFVSHKYLNMPLPQDGRLDPGAWEKLEWDGFLPHLRDAAVQWDREHSEVPAKKSRLVSTESEYPGRAEWLEQELEKRKWKRSHITKNGGPDPKTVRKILHGEGVSEGALDTLAGTLSKKIATVDPGEIPDK